MTLRFTRLETAIAIIAAAQLALAVFIAMMGSTAPIPMHFNIAGEVDRWGDRREAASVIVLMTLITLGAGGATAWSARRADETRRRGLAWAQGVVLATTSIMSGMVAVMASASVDAATAGPKITMMAVCLLLALIGAVLGKIPPNALVGVRTPWSLNSRLSWEKSNRLTGRLFFWFGLAGLMLAPAAPTSAGPVAIAVALLLIAAIGVYESWRVWRADPERRIV